MRKVQLVQTLEPNDRPKRMNFATHMLRRIEEGFLRRILCSDEDCFHISGTVNPYNVQIWGSEVPMPPLDRGPEYVVLLRCIWLPRQTD